MFSCNNDPNSDDRGRSNPLGRSELSERLNCILCCENVSYDDCVEVRGLLSKGADPCCLNDSQGFPLLLAANQFRSIPQAAQIVRLLLEAGADPNQHTPDEIYPIHYAARAGNLEVVRMLIDAGSPVNLCMDGRTLVHLAAEVGSGKLIELLLEKGAELTSADKPGGESPLFPAARCCNPSSIEALLAVGLEPNVQTASEDDDMAKFYGQTPLLCAAATASSEPIRFRSVLYQQTEEGLGVVAETQKVFNYADKGLECCRLLLEAGADPNITSNMGFSAILLGVKNNNLGLVELLLRHGADPNIGHSVNGESVLEVASSQEMKELLSGDD